MISSHNFTYFEAFRQCFGSGAFGFKGFGVQSPQLCVGLSGDPEKLHVVLDF